eukprot:3202718-Rhodomonas_salina.1
MANPIVQRGPGSLEGGCGSLQHSLERTSAVEANAGSLEQWRRRLDGAGRGESIRLWRQSPDLRRRLRGAGLCNGLLPRTASRRRRGARRCCRRCLRPPLPSAR